MNSFESFVAQIEKCCNGILAFPKEHIEDILKDTPLLKRYMMPFFLYLPLKDKEITAKTVEVGAGFYLVDLAFTVHKSITENDSMDDKLSVLAGDLIHSSGFRFFVHNLSEADVRQCVDVFLKQSTAWFLWRNGNADIKNKREKHLQALEDEFVSKFVKVGEIALDMSSYEDEEREKYLELCRLAAMAWGAKVRGCDFDIKGSLEQIRVIGGELNLNDELEQFYHLF